MEYQQLPPDSEKAAEDGLSGLMQSKSTLDGDTPIPPATAGVQEQNNSGLEEYERHLIRGQRFKISMVCVMVLVASLSIGCMVLSISQYRKQYANKACGSVLLSLSNATSTLIVEAIASIYYVADPTAEDDVPDRVIAAPMLALQANTREQLFKSLEEADVCSSQSNYGMLGIAELLKLQGMVMMRLINATECSLAYRDAAIRMGSTLSFYTGVGVGEGIASMVWYEQLLLAVRAMGTMAISATAKNHSHQADLYAFNYSSIAMVALQLVQALSAVMDPYEPTLVGQFLQSIFRPAMVIQGMVLRVGGDFDNLQVVGELEPLPAINALIATFQEIIKELQHAKPWANASFKTWFATICLFAVVIILCFGVALLTTRDILFSIFSARAEVIEIYNTSRLEGSMARMEYFMDRVYHMDADGVREIVEISANYPMTTAVERNVLKLEAPVLQVLSYVNPCIMGRRLESLRSDTDSLLHESILQGNQQESLVEDGDLVGQLSLMDDGHWDAEEKSSGKELMLSGLYNSHACLLLIDFSLFCADISAERFKTIPGELKTLYKEIAELVNRFHGHVLGTSGSVLIAGWNACGGAFVDQPENSVGFLLLKLQDEVLQRKRILQCAVVSGTIPQGVVGSGTLQTFVMEGSLLRMGRYLLQIARDHDTSFVVDFSTFLRLDTRQFYKRALQKVALDSRCKGVPGNETVVFELLPTSSEVSQQNVLLWNEAFDNFHTGHIEEAKVKLRRWERLYGSTPSWNSLMMCIGERPPRTITYLYTDTEEGFDVSMVL